MNKRMWNKRKVIVTSSFEKLEEKQALFHLRSSELLLWQTRQLHAKLRQRLTSDPQAVRMIDNLVTNFYYTMWISLDESITTQDVVEQIARAQLVLGQSLPEEVMRASISAPLKGMLAGA